MTKYDFKGFPKEYFFSFFCWRTNYVASILSLAGRSKLDSVPLARNALKNITKFFFLAQRLLVSCVPIIAGLISNEVTSKKRDLF